jgi:hypothetical protein
MGVLACNKNGCKNIMCDRCSSTYGYICDECFSELMDWSGWGVTEFMQTTKGLKQGGEIQAWISLLNAEFTLRE